MEIRKQYLNARFNVNTVNADYIATVIDPDHFHFRKTTKLNSSTSLYARSYTVVIPCTASLAALAYFFPKLLIGAGSTGGNSGAFYTA